MLQLVEQQARAGSLHGVVFHSDCLDEAEALRDRVEGMLHCAELHVSDFTPAMGIHTGPGVLGVAYYSDG
jgi:fatty acid-binding protein DegV